MIEVSACCVGYVDESDEGSGGFDFKEHVREVRELVRTKGASANEYREIINLGNVWDGVTERAGLYGRKDHRSDIRSRTSVEAIPVQRDSAGEVLQCRFEELAAQWKKESRFIASVATKAQLGSYRQIIKMGRAVVPLVLRDLELHGPSDWFWALSEITGENPITNEIAGNMRAMTEAWLQWGKLNNCRQDFPPRTKAISRPL